MYQDIKQNTKEKYIGHKNEFRVKSTTFKKENNIPIHFHEYYEIEIITSGSGIMTLNGNDIPFKKGMVFFLLPNDFHKFIFFEETQIYNISFCENVLFADTNKKRIIEKTNNYLNINERQLSSILTLCDAIIKLDDINDKSRQYLLKSLLELFPCLYNIDVVSSYFGIAVAFIENHFKDNITATDVAKQCLINEDYLNKIFKKEINITVTDYIRKKRLHYASVLLKSSKLSVSEIAYNSGFQSIQTFNRVYKSYYGVSPSKNR
ncbi:MAG: AraC family transcriptional regulator [Clostridia bacterium]|nr:AraC family transcriptional regulator [Clostridia bacterium]